MRTLARRGLCAGASSAAFSTQDLRHALRRALCSPHNVYLELDNDGQLCGRGGGGGAAGAAVGARLAPAAPSATLLLSAPALASATPALASPTPAPVPAPALRLRLRTDAPPLQELQLWFDDAALALLDMPVLSLNNIQGKKNYVCHDCGAEFEQPNTLKVHLFLSCQEYSLVRFWEGVCSRLETASACRSSAFQPYEKTPAMALAWPLCTASAAEHAAVEALAAAWGRAQGAHACLYCGKLYSRKYGLKIHIRTHTGYKPLRCRYCLRAFGDPSNLNKHVRLHAARAPSAAPSYACPRCAQPLARRRDLERHMRARHANTHSPSDSLNTP